MAHSAKKILSAIFFVIVFTGRLALPFYNIHLNILTQLDAMFKTRSVYKNREIYLNKFLSKGHIAF